jgi:ATP-binding cassette subfamily B protein
MEVKPSVIRLYWHYAKKYPRSLWIILTLLPLVVLASSFLEPYIISHVFNILAKSSDKLNLVRTFGLSFGLYISLEIFQLIGWRIIVARLWTFELHVMRDLANAAFRHVIQQSDRFHSNRFGGALVSQSTKFVSAFERLFDTLIFDIGTLVLSLIFTIAFLMPRAPLYASFLIVFTVIYFLLVVWRMKKQLPLNAAEAQKETARTAQLADSITNIATVKSFGQEEHEMDLFGQRADTFFNAGQAAMKSQMINEGIFTSAISVVNIAALTFGVVAVVQFHEAFGTLYLIISYTTSLLRQLFQLTRIFRNVNRVFSDAKDMTEILALDKEVRDPETPIDVQITDGEIVFENVSFRYKDTRTEDHLFHEFSLNIPAGQRVGLVGPSGSGKTTLTKLILRFSDLNHGTIRIDGHNIADMRQSELRRHVAYVPQEPILFHRTLLENIRYGRLSASDEEVKAAAHKARADEFIDKLPNGYETLVGERGTKLSGGQRQRVAIARAILRNAPILVLDEATSALDSESEKLIQAALQELMKGRTTIVVAHRLSTIQKMDRIIVLDNGEIVEDGTHEELLKEKGLYAKLWTHQSGGCLED